MAAVVFVDVVVDTWSSAHLCQTADITSSSRVNQLQCRVGGGEREGWGEGGGCGVRVCV